MVIHWVKVVAEGVDKQIRRGKDGRNQNSLFYADDGMVASSDPRWIHGVFSTPTGLCDRVILNPMSGIQLEWSAACARRREHSKRRRTGKVWRDQGLTTRRDSVFGYSARRSGRRWR